LFVPITVVDCVPPMSMRLMFQLAAAGSISD
jgi:hypothetical protein